MSNELIAGLAVVALGGLGTLVTFLYTTVAKNAKATTEIAAVLGELRREVRSLPRTEDLANIRVEIEQVNSRVGVLAERTVWIGRIADRRGRLADAAEEEWSP